MNLVDCLQTQRKVERYETFVPQEQAASFLNFVPNVEVPITAAGSCLQNCSSVAKLHLIDQ